jgi:hypothetical protein
MLSRKLGTVASICLHAFFSLVEQFASILLGNSNPANWASAQIKAVLKGLGINISISLNRGNLKKLYLDYVNTCFNEYDI